MIDSKETPTQTVSSAGPPSRTISWPIGLLLLFFVLQLLFFGQLIYRLSQTASHGNEYRFRTALYDPMDPFRGRYVQLAFDLNSVDTSGLEPEVQYGERIYAEIETDEEGFARFGEVHRRPPAGRDHLELTVEYETSSGFDEGLRQVSLPFDRYFMNEELAPEAERVFREQQRLLNDDPSSDEASYALVRITGGSYVMEDLVVAGRPIEEWLELEAETK